MNQKQIATPPGAGIALEDIYHVLFRRKWLILILTICGITAAVLLATLQTPIYESSATLYIQYIIDSSPAMQTGNGIDQVKTTDSGAGIVASEIELIRSRDIAKAAADYIQPSKILAPYHGGTNLDDAANLILANLAAEPTRSPQMFRLTFTHKDLTVVQPVLDQIITNYINREEEIHLRNSMFQDDLTRERDKLNNELKDIESQIATAKNNIGVVDTPAALAEYQSQEGGVKSEINKTLVDLAEATTIADEFKKMMAAQSAPDAASATNTNAFLPPSKQTIAAYNKLSRRLEQLQSDRSNLEDKYTDSNPLVKANASDIEDVEKKMDDMEKQFPALLVVAASKDPNAPNPAGAYTNALAKIDILNSRLSAEQGLLDAIRVRGTNLNVFAGVVRELETTQVTDEDNLKKVEAKLYQIKIDNETGNRISGIFISDNPSPPTRDANQAKVSQKLIAGLAVGGFVLGLAIAFLWEMYLDRSFKRPHEVGARLKMPFFLSIPYLNGSARPKISKGGNKNKLLTAAAAAPTTASVPPSVPAPEGGAVALKQDGGAVALKHDGEIAPWDEKHALRPFHETLRDRLVAFFEMINLTHKPKLVAVTSCDEGAGVSTIAAGLASSLSETGEGNVLLVNMNSEHGEAHHFYKGELAMGIDQVLEKDNREGAMVQDNLYVVQETTNRDRLPSILPKRFGSLVSKLKASDYDYIIFDMPPVTQISVTPRLARFMDMVLLVVEAQKTDRDVAQRASALLAESKANVGVVMNKTRSYIPKRLLQEL